MLLHPARRLRYRKIPIHVRKVSDVHQCSARVACVCMYVHGAGQKDVWCACTRVSGIHQTTQPSSMATTAAEDDRRWSHVRHCESGVYVPGKPDIINHITGGSFFSFFFISFFCFFSKSTLPPVLSHSERERVRTPTKHPIPLSIRHTKKKKEGTQPAARLVAILRLKCKG